MVYTILVWNLLTAAANAAAVRWILPYIENTNNEKTVKLSVAPSKLFIITSIIVAASSLISPIVMPDMSSFSIYKIGVSFSVLSVAFVTDYIYYRIPNILPMILAISRIICLVPELLVYQSGAFEGLLQSLLVTTGTLIFLLAVRLISKEGLGYGDIKLISALAFLCGFRAGVFTLLFSFMVCAIVSILLLFRRKKTLKDTLPLGPFLLVGFALTVVLGVG